MKIKIDIDYENNEYTSLLSTLGMMLNRIMDTVDKNNERNHELELLERQTSKNSDGQPFHNFTVEKESDSEDYEEDSSEEDSEIDSLSEHVEAQEVSDNEMMISEGCTVYEELMKGWLVNFDQADKEQPDRAGMLRTLSISRDGFRILAYLHSKKSLTYATLDYLEKYQIDSPNDTTREQYARQIAEHLSQVSSIIFYQISDFLQYPNPLEK